MKQSISNCCGTIALLHALCNTYDQVGGGPDGDSFLAKYLKNYGNTDPTKYVDEDSNKRAKYLHGSPELEAMHAVFAS